LTKLDELESAKAGFTIELVGEIANMVRLSAGPEVLRHDLVGSSVKVVAIWSSTYRSKTAQARLKC
jgi:hypothetical protein